MSGPLETHPYQPVKTEDEDGEFMVCAACGKGDLEHTDSYPYLIGKEDGAAAERARLREKVEAKRETVSGHLHAAFQSGKTASILYWKETGREEAFREVLALLAEPPSEPPT